MSMQVTDANSEFFIVCRDKIDLIDSLKGKIERLFGTRIYFKEISKDGDKEKRWVQVSGGKWDRQNAKTYIIGLCSPEETKLVPAVAEFIDSEILENIEKDTQAVLIRNPSRQVKISGNELAVTLALSALEELTGGPISTDNVTKTSDMDASRARSKTTSILLDEKLEQTFGDGCGSLQHYPDAIKRVLLQCGRHSPEADDDNFEDMLHGPGIQPPSQSADPRKFSTEVVATRNSVDPRKTFTAPVAVSFPAHVAPAGLVVADGACGWKSVEGMSKDFSSAAQISSTEQQTGKNRQGADAEALRQFATQVGYTDEEVDEGFLYMQAPVKPADFIANLMKIKESKKNLGLVEHSPHHHHQKPLVEEVDSSSSDDSDVLMIVDDHYQKVSPTRKPLSPKAAVNTNLGASSKYTTKKNSDNDKRQKDLAKEFQLQNSGGGGRKKKRQKPAQVVPGTKRKSDPDSDHEQTSVMKVWDPVPQSSNFPESVPVIPPRQQRMVDTTMNGSEHLPQTHSRAALLPDPVLNIQMGYANGTQDRYQDQRPAVQEQLRYIIIDGSNVAMSHGNGKVFSCKGIQIAVNFFVDRGHKVTVFIPEWRKYRNWPQNNICDQDILFRLEESEHLVFTPSRKIRGKLVVSYDDRYVLSLAEKEDSIILSNDQYRDLMREKVIWKKIVEERLLMYRFVGDHFMPAEDPLGRNGPMLDDYLRIHPHTSCKADSQQYRNQNQQWINRPQGPAPGLSYASRPPQYMAMRPWQVHMQGPRLTQAPPFPELGRHPVPRQQMPVEPELPTRNHDTTEQLLAQLRSVFSEPEQEDKVKSVLFNHSCETDLNRLTNYCIEVIFP